MISKQNWGGTATPCDIYPPGNRYCCGWACECDWYSTPGNPPGQGVEFYADYNYVTGHVPGYNAEHPF